MAENTVRPVPTNPDEISAPGNRAERLELARELFQEFYTRCFWHCPEDLVLTEDHIPMVEQGLRIYGGRRGFLVSAKLREPLACR